MVSRLARARPIGKRNREEVKHLLRSGRHPLNMASRSAAAVTPSIPTSSYGEYVNPRSVKLLKILAIVCRVRV